ncbi:MAG: hypothetical protein MUP64_04150 [Anaerolineae bacterium]|nr:hypothetical protein [Anaerolineae bacterium]
MKKNLLIFILVFSFALLFSAPAFAYTYSRTPAGSIILRPVTFNVGIQQDTCVDGVWALYSYYNGINPNDPTNQYFTGGWTASSTLNKTFVLNLPYGDYEAVAVFCSSPWGIKYVFEGVKNSGVTIFSVVAQLPPPPPQIFGYVSNFNTNFSESVFNFGSQLLADLRVVLYILIGLALGMGIIIFILNFFEDRKTK